jgi:hypothetical protein
VFNSGYADSPAAAAVFFAGDFFAATFFTAFFVEGLVDFTLLFDAVAF